MTKAEDAALRFEQLGVDYYIAGRSAVLAQRVPLCGNLFHHSIEMFIKAGLSRSCSLEELAKRQLGHNLPRLWTAFKAKFPGADLDRFDNTVARLDRFERLRYPDAVLVEGMAVVVQWEPGVWKSTSTGKMPPEYPLVVNDIDQLVAKIFQVCGVNSVFFTQGLTDYARDALTRNNPVAEFLAPKHRNATQ